MNGSKSPKSPSAIERTVAAVAPRAREELRYQTLERQPVGWVKVFHSLAIGKKLRLELWYTPDHHVLDRRSAAAWLAHYSDWNGSLEDLTFQLMDDFRNEIIPCWVRLRLQKGKDFVVEAEDRQPNWTPQRGSKFIDSMGM